MRSRASLQGHWLHATIVALGCAAAATGAGCHPYTCGEWLDCAQPAEPVPVPEAPACVADPAAGPVEDRCGVFVSSSLGDDDAPGTQAQPVRSLAQAITLAQAGPMRVYACAETFEEAVVLAAGVELYGGLDCTRGWGYLGGDRKTVIAPDADAVPVRVQVQGDSGRSVVADVRAEAADAQAAGGSSIAMMVMPLAAVEILRSELIARDGAAGAAGEDGGALPAPAGAPGQSGAPACSAQSVPGGAATRTTCGALESIGGQGGEGNLSAGGDGFPGQPEPVPNPQGFGLGGTGETVAVMCSAGESGANGVDGAHGEGAAGSGKITLLGWQGQPGQDGVDGLPGQGAGGGGGALGGPMECANQIRGGAGGGSGGAGGCGGRGGRGGGSGGASIGLLSLSTQVTLRTTTIFTGNGGDGGAGGLGQLGGPGGASGPGGAGTNAASPGCPGGVGGDGGTGGYGGGGSGGPSLGIAHVFGQPVTQEGVIIQVGMAGQGGLGGNPAAPEGAGEDGIRSEVAAFPQ